MTIGIVVMAVLAVTFNVLAKRASGSKGASQTAVPAWLARHRVTIAVVTGGLVLLTYLGLVPLGHGFPWLAGASLAWVAVLVAACWWVASLWWMRKRRRQLAQASLPAPHLRQMLTDRHLERKRTRRILAQWPAFCDAYSFHGGGKLKIVPKLWQFSGTIELDIRCMVSPGPLGVKEGVDKLVNLAWQLKEIIGDDCKEVLVRRIGTGHAEVTFLWTEALERVLPVADMPAASKDNEVAYGVRRSGKAATVRMCDPILLGGMTGSGKSGWAWALLADLNRKGLPYECYVGNLKGGAEFRAYADKVGQRNGPCTVVGYAEDIQQTVRLIQQFHDDMYARAKEYPHRQWLPKHADQYPLAMLWLDEMVALMLKMDAKQRAVLDTCVSQGRANGFWVIGLSQKGQVSILKDTRDFFPQRLSLAQPNRTNTEMFLGEGAEDEGALCSKITNRPGIGYSYDDGRRGYELFRAARVDDDDMEKVAAGMIPQGMDGKAKLPVSRDACVYMFFTSDMQCLYVGEGYEFKPRRDDHAGLLGNPAKWWWEYVDESKTPLPVWCGSKENAEAYEQKMIAKYQPVGNEQLNKDNNFRGRKPEPLPAPVPEPAQNVTPITRRRPAKETTTLRRRA